LSSGTFYNTIYGIVCGAMKIFLVIPTIRNLNFLAAWSDAFADCHVLIVEDGPKKTVRVPRTPRKEILHYCWQDIRADFGQHEWIFSRKNAGIRSYGFWKAHELGADIIITLDDDCYPVEGRFVQQHVDNLSRKAPRGWVTTYPNEKFVYTRGIPYKIRDAYPVMISHGLWTNKIDLDGITEINYPDLNLPAYPPILQFIPQHAYFPMCSMNLAFRREVTPLMYFPLMGANPEGAPWGYDRFDDIWAGIFAKKIIDHLGWAAVNGSPFIEHKKASDPQKNILKEKRGITANEWMWKRVDEAALSKDTPAECYVELAKNIRFPRDTYFERLREAMGHWGNLFHE
jgi:reversibly glycosylated polypeptide / UDP-arabinopyranose mutase